MARNPFHRADVSKVQQMQSELRKLSQEEPRQIREWLDDCIEDELVFAPKFAGKPARVRQPQGS